MIIPPRFSKATYRKRSRCLSVVVFPDQESVFQAYRLLYHHGISLEHLAIVGQGFNSPERVGLRKPLAIIGRKSLQCAIAACSVGVAVAIAAKLWWSLPVDWPLLLAVVAGVSSLVGVLLGGVLSLLGEGTAASVYRHHLQRGHYLLMVEGSEDVIRLGQEVLDYYAALSPY